MANALVGKTIATVRTMKKSELELFSLDYGTEVIEFTDGTRLIALRDAEGNGPGQMIYAEGKGKKQFYVSARV
jgi:hypothetical protein